MSVFSSLVLCALNEIAVNAPVPGLNFRLSFDIFGVNDPIVAVAKVG
jgi:hypothetical protein